MIDCHSHLSFLDLTRAQEIIESSQDITSWVMGGYSPEEWLKQRKLKELYPKQVLTCFGIHPWLIRDNKDFAKEDLLEKFKNEVSYADFVGEIGLDFHGEGRLNRTEQENLFKEQLELRDNKPVVLHVVQAHGLALDIIRGKKLKGFVHGFSGSLDVAQSYFKEGLLLSFGPGVLRENFKKARETVKDLPLEAILIESDSPSHPNDSRVPTKMYQQVALEIADIKGIPLKDLCEQVQANFQTLL